MKKLDKRRKEVLSALDALPNEPIHLHFTKKKIKELAKEIARSYHEQKTT